MWIVAAPRDIGHSLMHALLLASVLHAAPLGVEPALPETPEPAPPSPLVTEPSLPRPGDSRFDKFLSSLSGHTRKEAPALTRLAGNALLWGGVRTSTNTELERLSLIEPTWRVYMRDEFAMSAMPIVGPFSRLVEGQLSAIDQAAYSFALGAQLGGAALLAASLLKFDFAEQVGEGLQFTSMSVNANGYGATVRIGGTF